MIYFIQAVERPCLRFAYLVLQKGRKNARGYLDQETIGQHGDEDTQRLVGEYETTEEFVSVLLKPQDRQSTYRVRVVPAAR